MQEKPTQDIQNEQLLEHIKFIYENAQSNDIKVVDTEPTTESLTPKDAPLFYSTELYFNIQGTLYKTTLTAV